MTDGTASQRDAQVFSPRTGLALALVGIFAFAAFVTLLAHAGDLQKNPFCDPTVYSKCAIGFAGLQETLAADGTPTLISRSAFATGRNQGLLIASPKPEELGNPAAGRADIGKLGFSGPILVVLPKWRTRPDPTHFAWGLKEGLVDPSEMPHEDLLDVATVDRRKGVARPKLVGGAATPFAGAALTPGPVDSLQTLKAKGWTPVLTDETGAVVMAEAGASRIFVLADPDLLNTQGLANPDTFNVATEIVRTLRMGDGPVIFDVSLDGYRDNRSVLKLIIDPPFLAVTLCIAAALALAGWQTLYRFGPARRGGRAFALGKEGLVDNSAQLIRLARREPSMAGRYAALTRTAAARAVGAPRDLAGDALTQFLDRISRRNGGESLASLTAEAGAVKDRSGLTALAERLYRWRLEMTRERQ